jgi:inner membrane protein
LQNGIDTRGATKRHNSRIALPFAPARLSRSSHFSLPRETAMQRSLAMKLAAIGVLMVLLIVALSCIGRLVTERQTRRDTVIQDIARSSSGEQQLTGPILVVPYKKTVSEWRENEHGDRHLEEREVSGQLRFLPETFRLQGDVRTERRARGIYESRLFHANMHITAAFAPPQHYGIDSEYAAYRFGQPFVAVGVSDIRGIESPLKAMVNGTSLQLLPGVGTVLLTGGVHADLPSLSPDEPGQLQLSIELPLLGTNTLHIVPIGRETQVDLKSNWPHPSFTGDFLPAQRQINERGFDAQWATSFFASNLQEVLHGCGEQTSCPGLTAHRLGVSFLDPVDQYLKTDRSIKYALLFISLTFAGFFLFDVLKSLPVHPIQYGLVGAALALFYLLLLSLSEHIGFAWAYLLSSVGCVGLIVFYVGHALRSFSRGLGFGCGLAVLYGCLFGLLAADDYALLMGSLLLFALLAAIMVLTRKVEWSKLSGRETSDATISEQSSAV